MKTVAPNPIGTCIKMLNRDHEGYEGVVVEVDDAKLDRPQIQLLTDATGERVDPANIDLREEGDLKIKSIRDGEPDLKPLGSSGSGKEERQGEEEEE